MPPNYVVQADVVDIRQDTPKPTDAFLVDTMVWHWLTYPKATPQPYQIQFYPPYLHQARSQRATLYYCGLSLAELGHQIEKSEREIFQKASGIQLGTKEYRHNYPVQRSQVATEVRTAWGIVKSLAVPLDAVVDDPTTDAALVRFQTQLPTPMSFQLQALRGSCWRGSTRAIKNSSRKRVRRSFTKKNESSGCELLVENGYNDRNLCYLQRMLSCHAT